MGPRLLQAIPKLASLDIERSLAFFDRLGFSRIAAFPDYGITSRDGIELHFWRCADKRIPKEIGCRMLVKNIEALHAEWSALGAVHPNGGLKQEPWGREFSILDEYGNLVTLHERGAVRPVQR